MIDVPTVHDVDVMYLFIGGTNQFQRKVVENRAENGNEEERVCQAEASQGDPSSSALFSSRWRK